MPESGPHRRDVATVAPAPKAPRTPKPRTRAELVAATLDAIRVLDLATTRYRTMTSQRWHVTLTDSLVISNLTTAGGSMTPRDLGRRLMISSGTLTSMLDRLEGAGFIARVPNPKDRRSLLIELTETGRSSLLYTGARLQDAVDAALPHGTSPASLEVLEALHGIAGAIDTVTDELLAEQG